MKALALVSLATLFGGCSGSTRASAPQLGIVAVSGAPLSAVAGDAVALQVVVVDADGSTHPLSDVASVVWTSPGNTAGDPAWNAALFAIAARAEVDNGGLTLRLPMPDWLTEPSSVTGAPLTTQDLADIYAFLKTRTQ
jgi:hypothetical protein